MICQSESKLIAGGPLLDLALQLLDAVLHKLIERPLCRFKGQGTLLVVSEELDGWISLDIIWLACLPFLVHIHSAHPDNAVQYLCCLLKLWGRTLAVATPGSCIDTSLP